MFKKIYIVTSVLCLTFSQAYAAKLSPEKVDALIQKREEIRSWAPTCADGSYSEKMSVCHQHDVTLFAGISCLAATLAEDHETAFQRCLDVQNAQGDNGRWWRGKHRVDDGKNNSFSRDMARGALSYLLAKIKFNDANEEEKDFYREQAVTWLNWIANEGNGEMCIQEGSNSCKLTIGVKNLFYEVMREVGVFKLIEDSNTKTLVKKIKRKKNYESWIYPIEVSLTPKGYPRHLKATSLLIYRIINMDMNGKIKDKSKQKRWKRVAKKLHRKDKGNLLMEFHNKGASDELASKLIATCPSIAPRVENDLRDFRWQRDGGDLSNSHRPSDGHDCIYLINLMLAHNNGNLYW